MSLATSSNSATPENRSLPAALQKRGRAAGPGACAISRECGLGLSVRRHTSGKATTSRARGARRVARETHPRGGRCASCAVPYRPALYQKTNRSNGALRRRAGVTTVVSASRAAMPHDASEEFRRCLRERVRLARELAALRAGFATVAEHYERVLRTMHALGPSLGISQQEIGRPTDPEWGPAALLVYGDERFLKHEQAVIDQLLRKLP